MGELGIFAVILIIGFIVVLWEEAPWVLVLIGLGIVALVVYCIKNPSRPSGSGYSYSPSNTPTTSDHLTTSGSSSETLLYRGRTTTWEPVLATSRGGRIFEGYNSGLNMSIIRASYEDGWVYDGSLTGVAGTVLGRYDDEGYIYLGRYASYDNRVGYCKDGYIYRGTSTYGEIIGCYEGNRDDAAAAAVVFLFAE